MDETGDVEMEESHSNKREKIQETIDKDIKNRLNETNLEQPVF